MKYKTSKKIPNNGERYEPKKIVVSIRCNDECKNGHDTFAITGELWEVGDTYRRGPSTCGCIHNEIIKYYPEFQLLVDLHLSDGNGLPMYALENGFYHLQGVQGVAAYDHTCTLEYFAEYMRISIQKAQALVDHCHRKIEFALFVKAMEPIYLQEATDAKQMIQALINGEATPERTPTQDTTTADVLTYTHETSEDAQSEVRKAIEAEKIRKAQEARKEIEDTYDKKRKKALAQYQIDLWVLENAPQFRGNVIYYEHIPRVCFGWYKPLTKAQYDQLLDLMPEFNWPYELRGEKGVLNQIG